MVGGGSACEGMRLRRRVGVRQGGRGRALMVLQLAVVMPRVAELAVVMAVVVRISRESGGREQQKCARDDNCGHARPEKPHGDVPPSFLRRLHRMAGRVRENRTRSGCAASGLIGAGPSAPTYHRRALPFTVDELALSALVRILPRRRYRLAAH